MELFKGSDELPKKDGTASGLREVLTGTETGIPGLSVLGHAVDSRPALPIIDHQHRNKFEVILVVRGIRRVSAGNLDYTLYPNHAFITCPNESHASLPQQPSRAEILWFQLDMSDRSGFLGLCSWEAIELHDRLSGFRARLLELPPALIRNFSDIFSLLYEGDALERIDAHALFVSSLIQMLRCHSPLERLTPEIDAAKQYILLHVKELIDPDELLLTSGLSMGEFRKRFLTQIGCSPRDYINRQKVERSKHTLLQTNRTIVDIAYEYHFSSSSFYKMQFRKETGMSPQKFRRKYKNAPAE